MIWAFESHAMQSDHSRGVWLRSVWVAAALLMVAPAIAQPAAEAPEATESVATEAGETPTEPTDNAVAAPTEVAPGTIVDYEPTESISEDLSVSFPVDI